MKLNNGIKKLGIIISILVGTCALGSVIWNASAWSKKIEIQVQRNTEINEKQDEAIKNFSTRIDTVLFYLRVQIEIEKLKNNNYIEKAVEKIQRE